jgi:type IV secretory pathway VirB2 component (pilin)
MMHLMQAYIPFVHPMNFVHEWWPVLLVPLAFGISVIYKAVRVQTLAGFWQQVLTMTVQIVLGMLALAIAVTIVVWLIPYLAQRAG